MNTKELQYPIGEFTAPEKITEELVKEWIEDIKAFPKQLLALTAPLSKEQLNMTYRPNGWTIKQVIHHCADSHMNSFIRFKLALTEDTPNIRPYFEDKWADLADGTDDDISTSLLLIKSLHQKWIKLLKSLTPQDLEKAFIHPETNKLTQLKENIGIYAWHGRHHLSHIALALNSKGIVE